MATESDNVNSGALGTLLAVGLFSVIGIAFVVTALVRSEVADELEKKEVGVDRPLRDLVAEQAAKLSAPAAYIDRGRGLVSLPIDRAMELTVEGLKKDPNSATPPPPPSAGGAGGTSATAATGGGGTGGGAPDAAAAGGTASPTGADSAAVEVAKPAEGSKEQDKGAAPEGKPAAAGDKPEKKDAPKKVAPAPVAPAPAPAAPAPAAPAPAPNGQ